MSDVFRNDSVELRCGRWAALAERFWSKVERCGDCWLWRGAIGKNGYGNLHVGSTRDGSRAAMSAHRVAFELAGGDPAVPVVMHRCDTKACVRPSHLVGGSQSENVRDCMAKGRHRPGRGGPRPQIGEKNGRSKINAAAASQIRAMAAAAASWSEIGKLFGISDTHAARVARGENWRHV